jgi:hypothetical protein
MFRRPAIHSSIIVVSLRNRRAILTFSRSPLRRPANCSDPPAPPFQFPGQQPLRSRHRCLLPLRPAVVPAQFRLHLGQQFLAECLVAQAPATLS